MNRLSVFDHFVKLALKRLTFIFTIQQVTSGCTFHNLLTSISPTQYI